MKYVITLVGMFFCLTAFTSAQATEPLVIAYNSDWPPYSHGVTEDVGGILPEVMDEIFSSEFGIEIKHVGYPWKRVQNAVEMGSVDAMITVPTAARLQYALSSKAVVYQVEMRAVVGVEKDHFKRLKSAPNIETLRSLKVCEITGNGWGNAFHKKNRIKPIMASKVASCLRMVAANRADVTIQSTAVANRQIVSEKLTDKLVVMPQLWGAMKFTLLVSKKSKFGTGFIERFDNAMKTMKASGKYQALIARVQKAKPAG